MKKFFIQKMLVVLKLSVFCFEISNLPSPGCCTSFIFHLLQLVCAIKNMAQSYLTGLEFLEYRGLNFSNLGQICFKHKLQIL